MPKWGSVPADRREQIFAYNKELAADSAAAKDMRAIAAAFRKLPPGQLKKVLTDDIREILARYEAEV